MKLIIFILSLFSVGFLLVFYPYFPSSNVYQSGSSLVDGDGVSAISLLLKELEGAALRATTFTTTTTTTANPPPPPRRSGPMSVPDFNTCRPGGGIFPEGVKPINCCPPANTTPAIDFSLLPPPTTMRVRRAVHLLDDEYLAKFSRAVQLMKNLPDDDPRSFKQQSLVHCAYCLGAHRHVGFPEMLIDIHQSWLYFPYHRLYMYFFERILGKLIEDPTFALPYWNWDSPEGMQIPEPFTDTNSSLYHELRDKKHQPPAIINLSQLYGESTATVQQQAITNLAVLYKSVVSGGRTPELFIGSPYHPGDESSPGPGSIEELPHAVVHLWVGDSDQPNRESMGPTYSAARDPLFYTHHSNIDRIWTIWKTLRSGKRTDLTDPDWLNSEFMFYDEEARLVRVKVQDCLDTEKLGYMFDDVSAQWVNARPTPRISKLSRNAAKKKGKTERAVSTGVFPVKLDKVVRVVVTRQANARGGKEEVLVIEGIEVGGDKMVKFDVIVNDEGNEAGIGPENTEFAGSYLSRHPSLGDKSKTSLRLGISELLYDLGVGGDESVVVTLVPRYVLDSRTTVTIGGVKIEVDRSS